MPLLASPPPFSFLFSRAGSSALGVEGTPKSAPRRSLVPLLASSPPLFPLSFVFARAGSSALGVEGTPISAPRRSLVPLLPPPPLLLSLFSSLPERLALIATPAQAPWPWAWRVPRNPHLGEA